MQIQCISLVVFLDFSLTILKMLDVVDMIVLEASYPNARNGCVTVRNPILKTTCSSFSRVNAPVFRKSITTSR